MTLQHQHELWFVYDRTPLLYEFPTACMDEILCVRRSGTFINTQLDGITDEAILDLSVQQIWKHTGL